MQLLKSKIMHFCHRSFCLRLRFYSIAFQNADFTFHKHIFFKLTHAPHRPWMQWMDYLSLHPLFLRTITRIFYFLVWRGIQFLLRLYTAINMPLQFTEGACGCKGSADMFFRYRTWVRRLILGFYSQTKSMILLRHGRWARRVGWLGLEASLGRWRGSCWGRPDLPYSLGGCLRFADRARAIEAIQRSAWLKTTKNKNKI